MSRLEIPVISAGQYKPVRLQTITLWIGSRAFMSALTVGRHGIRSEPVSKERPEAFV